jgi:hypothetical protein
MAIVENVTPILRIQDLDVSRHYYIEKLGFALDWDAGGMISVLRDGKGIMLCEREQGQPGTWLWIGVDDADALVAEFSTCRGDNTVAPMRNCYDYAYRAMSNVEMDQRQCSSRYRG